MSPPITSSLKTLIKRARSSLLQAIPNDPRSGRFVALIDCILNQNARDLGAARFPAMNAELLRLCSEHHVGILQMPCPEMAALGFKRTRQPGQSIRDALDTAAGRQCCAGIAREVADRIEAYLAEGYVLLAILGGNPQSPGCAVHDSETGLLPQSGVFMKELQAELRGRGIEAIFKSMRDHDPHLLEQDLDWLRGVLAGTPTAKSE